MSVNRDRIFVYSQSHSQMNPSDRSPSPSSCDIHLESTPLSTTGEQIYRQDEAALRQIFHVLKAAQETARPQDPGLWTQVAITKEQYDRHNAKLELSLRRFDFEPSTETLTVRMSSAVHDIFATMLAGEVNVWLKELVAGGGAKVKYASKIVSGGSSRILLDEGDSEHDQLPIRRQPDAQFQHQDAAYPGLVIEVSYSQDGKNLRKLAQDYILYSNGDIKAVVGIDLNYGGKESRVSLWRPQYTRKDNDDAVYLEAKPTLLNKPFRLTDGSPTNVSETLDISLDDLATDTIAKETPNSTLSISFKRLNDLLNTAEQMQQNRESVDGREGVKSKRRTRKRRYSSSSEGQLKPDELRFFGKEERALQ